MPAHKLFLNAKGTSYTTDLVLEQKAQGLYKLEVHPFRKPAHIVV